MSQPRKRDNKYVHIEVLLNICSSSVSCLERPQEHRGGRSSVTSRSRPRPSRSGDNEEVLLRRCDLAANRVP